MEGDDELANQLDLEFGDFAAEEENIEDDDANPQEHEGQAAAEEADADLMADAEEDNEDVGLEEEDNEFLGSPLGSSLGSQDALKEEYADALQELEELAAEEGEGGPSSSQQQPQSVQQLAAAHAAASLTDNTIDKAPAHDSAGPSLASQSSLQQGPAPKRRRTVMPSSRSRAQASAHASGGGALEQGQLRDQKGALTQAAGPEAGGDTQQLQQQCEHPSYWAGMCVCCGALKPEDESIGAGAAAPPPSMPATQPARVLHPPGSSEHSAGTPLAPGSSAAGAAGGAANSAAGGAGRAGAGRRAVRPKQASPAGGLPSSGVGVQGPGVRAQPAEPLTRIRHLHSRGQLEVSMSEAARVRQREVSRLLGEKRLVLVLDLDHTLLHSVRLMDVSPQDAQQLEAMLRAQEGQPKQLLHCLRHQNLWTKLRPGVHEFLEACRGLFEMHIYTMGDRSYAAQIRMLLDPQRRLFSSVISQNDSTSTAAKDLDVALADDRIVLILDDTEHVWPHHRRNLLLVERYHFFPGTMRPVNGVSGLLDLRKDESANQGALPTALRVLQDVHARFFASRDEGTDEGNDDDIAVLPLERRDVRYCLVQRREDILRGCRVCFSHCWPQGFPSPYSHPLWQLAETLGAECSTTYNPDTITHLVAGSSGTEKAVQARRQGKHVVTPDWLRACMFRWHREDEAAYAAALRPTPQLFLSPLESLHIPEPVPAPSHTEPPAQGQEPPQDAPAAPAAAAEQSQVPGGQGQAPARGELAASAAGGSSQVNAAEWRAAPAVTAVQQPQVTAGKEQGQQAGQELEAAHGQAPAGAIPGSEGTAGREGASAVEQNGGSSDGRGDEGRGKAADGKSVAENGTGTGEVPEAGPSGYSGDSMQGLNESGQTGNG